MLVESKCVFKKQTSLVRVEGRILGNVVRWAGTTWRILHSCLNHLQSWRESVTVARLKSSHSKFNFFNQFNQFITVQVIETKTKTQRITTVFLGTINDYVTSQPRAENPWRRPNKTTTAVSCSSFAFLPCIGADSYCVWCLVSWWCLPFNIHFQHRQSCKWFATSQLLHGEIHWAWVHGESYHRTMGQKGNDFSIRVISFGKLDLHLVEQWKKLVV